MEATRPNQEAKQQEDLYQRQETAPAHLTLGRRGHQVGAVVAGGSVEAEREHMFDKVLTPSDVGKLNRLVVPKQHAERYFPTAAAPGTTAELCFEDRGGTPWEFRYSYWGSSQSYVMTKGWSRFVHAACLAAGDTVSFSRSGGRYFIDYRHCQRRRRDIIFGVAADAAPARPFFGRARAAATSSDGPSTMVLDAARIVAGHDHAPAGPAGTSTRSFRLFGVNVECGVGDETTVVLEEEPSREERESEKMWRNRR
ncbi:hypothetical protein QYE76_032665 [Lolium multiflorum]|uniref:TF-B3 domain-containing protein n=1 Tax=Lolium multiflorum TaxID=4521 RepID=A0AAD8QUJ6_LOLMU|nr:hypothetical protein QYE76_032665 [Lolium multiflorum]